jgi:hypothetical protein
MIAHILGKGSNTPCPNASSEAWKTARKLKKGRESKRTLAAMMTIQRRNQKGSYLLRLRCQ